MSERTEELAYRIADKAARSDIEVYCAWTSENPADRWFDTKSMNCDAILDFHILNTVDESIEYLDGRGMLERCPDRAEWARIKTRESGDGG